MMPIPDDRSGIRARRASLLGKTFVAPGNLAPFLGSIFLRGLPHATAALPSSRARNRHTITQNRTSIANKLFASIRPIFFPGAAARIPGNWLNWARKSELLPYFGCGQESFSGFLLKKERAIARRAQNEKRGEPLSPRLAAGGALFPRPAKEYRMRRRPAILTVFLAAQLPFSAVLFAQTDEKLPAAKAPAAAHAFSHDLSGVWIAYPGNPKFPDLPGIEVLNEKFRPPLTAWGQAFNDATRPIVGPRAVAGIENDPVLRCMPDGPPMLITLPNPFEIVQIPGRMLVFHEETHIWRTIWADGSPLPKNPKPNWLGYSVGKWEGDTFVVETIGLNDRMWSDLLGDPRSEQMHITERYRRLDPDTLEIQLTVVDPKSYTKPWVSPPKRCKLEKGWEIAEWHCSVDEDKDYDDAIRKPAGEAPPK
jgi:hypothetical protein